MGTITDDQLQGSDTLPSTFTPSGFTTVPSATANITTSTGPTSQGFLTPAYPSTSTSLKASTSTGVASTPTGVPHASQSSIATGESEERKKNLLRPYQR